MQASEEEDMACGGLRRLLGNAQLAALPVQPERHAHRRQHQRARAGDATTRCRLVCPAGNAVLTPDSTGYYQITLDLREIPRGSDHWVLGMERTPWSDDDDDDDDDNGPKLASGLQAKQKDKLPTDWVKLMDDVSSLEFAFFDQRLNDWVPKWTDSNSLPRLVRLRISVAGNTVPYEFVERVPGGGVAKVIPTSVFPGGFNPLTGQTTVNTSPGQSQTGVSPNGSNPPPGQNGAR